MTDRQRQPQHCCSSATELMMMTRMMLLLGWHCFCWWWCHRDRCHYRHGTTARRQVIQNTESQRHWPSDDNSSFALLSCAVCRHPMTMEVCCGCCCVFSCVILNSQTSLLLRRRRSCESRFSRHHLLLSQARCRRRTLLRFPLKRYSLL